MIGCTISVAVNQEEICVNVIYLEATDTPAIIFWRRQCNGGKVVALPLCEGNCSCIMLSDDNRKLPAIDAEILNHNYGKIAENWKVHVVKVGTYLNWDPSNLFLKIRMSLEYSTYQFVYSYYSAGCSKAFYFNLV